MYKRKRIFKKRLKYLMDWFTRKLPDAFINETERKQFVSAWTRRQVGQKHRFPERILELTRSGGESNE